MKSVVRVLMHFHSDRGLDQISHVYLDGAPQRDVGSNVDQGAVQVWFSHDSAPPETTIDKKPTKKKRRRSILRFSSSERSSTFACSVDKGAPAPCTSPTGYKDLDRGRHSFSVAATDAAGNADPTPATTHFFLRNQH